MKHPTMEQWYDAMLEAVIFLALVVAMIYAPVVALCFGVYVVVVIFFAYMQAYRKK